MSSWEQDGNDPVEELWITTLTKENRMKKSGNPVAKFASKFNKAMVEVDRKRRAKLGYRKHKKPVSSDRASHSAQRAA